MSRRGLGTQAALLAILALAACGGGSEQAQGDSGVSEADVEDAGLDFARCMRERECRKHLQDLVSQIDEDQRREFQEARLDFARCMRDKGFDVPDPGGGGGPPEGGSSEQGGALGDLDLDDPRVRQAMETCAAQGPGLRPAE